MSMCPLRKCLALIELAESSEAGRLLALRAVMEAAARTAADMGEQPGDQMAQELLQALSGFDDWTDGSPWIEAFQRRLAQLVLPGLMSQPSLN